MLESKDQHFGYNALTSEFEDLVKAGVVDPTKVIRTALENAASVACMLLTSETLIVDLTEPEANPIFGGHGDMKEMY